MTSEPLTASAGKFSVLRFRRAYADEVPRASWVLPTFRGGPAPVWFLAVREQPVERIAGAIWFRPLPDGETGELDVTASFSEDELSRFLQAWIEEVSRWPNLPQRVRMHRRHSGGEELLEFPVGQLLRRLPEVFRERGSV